MSVFNLPNVCIAPDVRANYERDYPNSLPTAFPMMEKLLPLLSLKYPLWQFQGVLYNHNGFMSFHVVDKGEVLGYITFDWVGGKQKYLVRNKRIDDARERGNGYRTDDPNKVVTKIKKVFGRKTVTERLQEAVEQAEKATYGVRSTAQNKAQHASARLDTELMQFVRRPEIYAQFIEYARRTESVSTILETHETTMLTMRTTADLRNKYSKDETTLVVRDDDEYIVKTKAGVKIYMDYDLPTTLRGKIGMLKLVEANIAIDGVGMKLNDDLFVLMVDDGEGA